VKNSQELAAKDGKTIPARAAEHPIEIFARAFGLMES
jgi:hypothetical protein